MTLPIVLVPHPHVRCDEKILCGSPHVASAGSRVPVRRLYVFYRDGADVRTLRKRYPRLSEAQILDALAFAFDNLEVIEADLARERTLLARSRRRPVRPQGPEQTAFPFGEPPVPGRARRR